MLSTLDNIILKSNIRSCIYLTKYLIMRENKDNVFFLYTYTIISLFFALYYL